MGQVSWSKTTRGTTPRCFKSDSRIPPLQSNIKLILKIHIGPINDRSIGDLDTFVTGVCDGLMAAAPGGKLDPIWDDAKLKHIHPSKTIAIIDDSQVVSIQAEKIIGDTDLPWYEMILED